MSRLSPPWVCSTIYPSRRSISLPVIYFPTDIFIFFFSLNSFHCTTLVVFFLGYGAPTAFGYQGQGYQNNGYSNNPYPISPYPSNQYSQNQYPSNPYPNNQYQQVASQNYPTAFAGASQSTGYGGGSDYSGGYGPTAFSNKRAVQNTVAQESNINQVKSVCK